MSVEIKVPNLGESVNEVVISSWFKGEGERVERDESIAELESDKATVEVPAPTGGVMLRLLKQAGESAEIGETIAVLEESAAAHPAAQQSGSNGAAVTAPPDGGGPRVESAIPAPKGKPAVMPAAQRLLAERGLSPEQVRGSGAGGRVLKEDVLKADAAAEKHRSGVAEGTAGTAEGRAGVTARQVDTEGHPAAEGGKSAAPTDAHSPLEEIVRMSPIRRTIAERLVESQQTAALLTTFNEIDMSEVLALRKQNQERFQARYGIKLGFMSFFVKAAVDALKQFPAVNGEVRGTNIVYKNYYDIGIAIGGGKGLLVPVIRSADRLSFAELELTIEDYARRAQDNKIDLEELQGGTFTISNGGVYGSLMSTPIVNPPQVAILGMHAMQERPVVRDGQIVARPMMYVALTYDHRIIDGRESVTFLKRIKEAIEDPARMLLEV